MSAKDKSSEQKRIAYQEFGADISKATERAVPDLPPQQQNIKVQATRSGRKGKTVTVITGFQHQPATLAKLLKQLKTQCGSGGTVKDDTLEIQGNHKEKLVEILSKLGYKVKISGG
jgi:translation initiation factor 1